jgi:hypothetical protein
MNYKEIETASMGATQKHIIIDNGDGTFKTFPADESNPEYVAFLEKVPAKTTKTTKPTAPVEPEVVEPEAPEAE